ncbi:MAG TPA: tRNA lysidine(34) synthetase TilS [Thermoleophilia bacterium]|nr:tRNA lysidine(34) synthetase TilS [Thermoleophilia bacterium]
MARLPAACLRLQRSVAESIAATRALRPGEHALLLLSGGADSMALLSLVRAADRRLGLGLRLATLHVDYGLRGADSDRDRLIVERACAGAGLPFHVERLHGSLNGRDFQARARAQRYGRARQLTAEHGYDVIVTAHNRDDQAETVVYRLAKYASPRGLAGMRPRDRDLARPLLGAGAVELRAYCRAAGIEYGEDATNAEPRYARNLLRLEVLPLLEALNPRLAETLAAGAEQAAAEAQVLGEAAAEARARVERPRGRGDHAAVDLTGLAAEPAALRALLLHELLREAMGGDALVERRLVEAVLRLTERADDAGRVSLGRGLEAVRGGGVLRIRPVAAGHVCAPLVLEGVGLAAAGEAGVTARFCGGRWRVRLLPGAALDRAAAIAGEGFAGLAGPPRRVTLRHPRRGERFAPLGLGGETTVARHLAAARVPAERRPLAVVLDVDGRAAWVGGAAPARVAQPFRVAQSSVLTLHVVQEGT